MKKSIKFKEYFKLFLCVLIVVMIIHIFVCSASTYIFDSINVSYTSDGSLTADNVQDALDELYDFQVESLNKIYPVGSIYMTTNSNMNTASKVHDALGGTWEAYSQGRTPMGIGSNGTTNYTTVTTGGTESQSYTPAGTNSGMGVTFNAASLSHSGGAVSGTALTAAQLPKITGSITLHNSEAASPIASVSGCFSSGATRSSYTNVTGLRATGHTSIASMTLSFGGGQTHTHSFTQPSAHSFTPSAKSYTQSTFTGTAATISHMQPYATVYIYRRTA